jgi:hypothetical protein
VSKFLEILTDLEEEMLWEMANFRTKTTGLPMIVYISTCEVEGKKLKHSPRVKIARTYSTKFNPFDTFSISISNNPEIVSGDKGEIKNSDLEKCQEFILKNKDVLMAFWDGEYDSADLTANLTKYE